MLFQYQPFLLLFQPPLPEVEVVEVVRAALAQVMEQIEIEPARARTAKGRFELRESVLARAAVYPRGVLGREHVSVARVTLHQRAAYRVLAARVRPGRVEIGKARGQEHVDHLTGLRNVDLVACCPRQTHQPETQFFDVFSEV